VDFARQRLRRRRCTTNAIEALNRQLRKAIKTKGHFPHEDAARKLIYLALHTPSPPGPEPGTGPPPCWALPISTALAEGMQTMFANPHEYPIDSRAVAYHFAFFSAKHYGTGQFYLFAIKDRQGQGLDGASDYRLTVPPNVPVNLYWSATIYDRATHTLIRDLPLSCRSSNTPGLQENPDGSVDILFGPQAPRDRTANWMPTKAGREFEALFRFYGPEKPVFDKTWQLPDIQATS
jgi:hypothetical protein